MAFRSSSSGTGATQILALDQSPSFANLFPQHEVAFSVHHQLSVNHLAFELVVSVVVSVVVLALVSTLAVLVLVPVSVHLVSPVVLFLDEIAGVLDPFVIAVSVIATRTVVAYVVFAAETLSVAAVVSGPAVWIHHACLERSSGSSPPILIGISRISPSAGDAIRSCSFAHLIAVAR